MLNFFLGVISSLVSTLLYVFGAVFFTNHFKKQLLLAIARLTGSGVEYTYACEKEAADDMLKYAKQSKAVTVFSMRAFRMLKDDAPLAFLLRDDSQVESVRILLADADALAAKRRAEEFVKIDRSYTVTRYIEDIRWSVLQVAECADGMRLSLRIHKEPAFIRTFLTEDFLFLSFFGKNIHGDESPVFRISRLSPLYEAVSRYFEWVWNERSSPLHNARRR